MPKRFKLTLGHLFNLLVKHFVKVNTSVASVMLTTEGNHKTVFVANLSVSSSKEDVVYIISRTPAYIAGVHVIGYY